MPDFQIEKVPMISFDGASGPPEMRLALFREVTNSIFDAWPLDDPQTFAVTSTGYRVGPLIFNKVFYSPIRTKRDEKHLIGDGADFLVLERHFTGEQHIVMPKSETRILPNRLFLRDWSIPYDSYSTHRYLESILIPRALLAGSATLGETRPIISWSLDEPVGQILAQMWDQLLTTFETCSLTDAEVIADGFIGYLDGIITHGENDTFPTTLAAMQSYLGARLSGNVDVADLCAHFKVSRSTVFRLFKPIGGVARYLTQTRLNQCYEDLCRAEPGQNKIGDIARAWGFPEATTFNRSFRRQFGCAPSSIFGSAPGGARWTQTAGPDARNQIQNTEYRKWFEDSVSQTPLSPTVKQ